MNYRELIDALTFLKENRKLGSEADELVAPFKDLVCFAEFRFESLSRTFANPHDPQFEGGQTMVGDLIGSEVDFSLLLPPEQTEWVESLERGEEFECSVNFLGFDGLYQRGIFGFVGKLEPEDEIDSLSDETEEQVDEPLGEEESVEVEEQEEEAPPEDSPEDPQAEQEEKAPQEEQAVIEEILQAQPEQEDVSDEITGEPDHKDVSERDRLRTKPSPKDPSRSGKNFTPQDVGSDWRSAQLDRKSKDSDRRPAQLDRKSNEANRWEIERVMDKEYVHGIESLSEKERMVYSRERARIKAKQKARTKSQKKPRKKPPPPNVPSRREIKKKIEAPGGCRLVFSVFLIICTLISLSKGFMSAAFFLALVSTFMIHPWIVHWNGSDPFEGFYKNEFLKEQKFRRGLGLLLLSFLMFGISKLFAVLLLIPSISMIVKSETYKNMTG